MDLTNKKCVPCEGGVDKFTADQISHYLPALESGWEVREGTMITREFKFKNFLQAMDFANRVGEVAESEGHHPDLHVSWGKVVIDLWTHAVGGLSENDFIMASKIDRLRQP